MNLAILQARMSSTRLPGKVLAPILGKPMILRQIERINICENIDELIVATSTDSSDDELVEQLRGEGVPFFRGPLNDVLSRFVLTAEMHQPQFIVRLTADCPLTDPKVIDAVIEKANETKADYTSNCFPRTFPRGLDVEVIMWNSLIEINAMNLTQFEREHVAVRLFSDAQTYVIANFEGSLDYSYLRWTVDTETDLEFVQFVYENLYPLNHLFSTSDILDLIRKFPDKSNLEISR